MWKIDHPTGKRRVIVTKELPGERWREILRAADCRVEVCQSRNILSEMEIRQHIGNRCDGAIGQLTELWGEVLFSALKNAGGVVYSNYAVGYNNVDVASATKYGIAVGNTPGVLTETTAEMAVALTFAAARRVVEADSYVRSGQFTGWQPDLFLGKRLYRKTVGVIGAGRIGSAYAKMMVEGFKMNLIYHNPAPNAALEAYLKHYTDFRHAQGDDYPTFRYAGSIDEVLAQADVISLHCPLNDATHHLLNAERLAQMKPNAILINTSRGAVIDERALVNHCRCHPDFRVGLDVFEDEPRLTPGLAELPNVTIVPHIASASRWAREGMATLAATNVAAILRGFPVWNQEDMSPFEGDNPPHAAPSIVNAVELGLLS